MIALWRHDRRWLGTFFVLLLGTFLLAWAEADGDNLWIPGMERNSEDVRWIAMAGAFVLGLYATARERVWATHEPLLHRATTGARILRARLLACTLVLAGSLALAMLASRAGWLDRFTYDSVWESTRWPVYAAELTCVFPALALGAMLGAAVRGVALGVLLVVGLAVPVAWWSRECLDGPLLLTAGTGHVAPWLYVTTQLALALPLAALATSHFTRPADADAGRAQARPVLLAALLLLGWAPLITWGLRHLEDVLYARVKASWPTLVAASDGSVLRSVPREGRHAYAVDEYHVQMQPTGQASALVGVLDGSVPTQEGARLVRGAASPPDPWHRAEDNLIRRDMLTLPLVAHADVLAWRRAARLGEYELRLRPRPAEGAPDALFLVTGTRAILASIRDEAVHEAHGQKAYLVALTRPDGQPPRIVDHVAGADDLPPVVLLDGTDGTLWSLVHPDRPDGALRRIPGPGEDPVLRIEARVQSANRSDGRGWTRRLGAVTETALYDYVHGGWVAVDAGIVSPEAATRLARRLTAHSVGDDPLDATLELRDTDAAVVAAHRYRPMTPRERAWALTTKATAVLMPPAALLLARLPGMPAGIEPLVHSGHHDLLIGLSLALATVLAWWTRRRLRRLDVPTALRRVWVGGVLLAGPAAFALHLVLVRRRAWSRASRRYAPPPRLTDRPVQRARTGAPAS